MYIIISLHDPANLTLVIIKTCNQIHQNLILTKFDTINKILS